ncbi:helix-turn-helix domain-containing protein [Nocardioides sp.]|uniref:helix-turn-helix transcriptional regulator n=1 Tax=Nocardioides sp. TaxID=35761 RepID=UPI0025F07C0B|nr:helix-turn-helix domain-containing protein [Nocardioides sp.]
MNNNDKERLLKAEDVGARLSVPATWVYAAARRGLIPSVQVGRYVRFRSADIEAWIAQGGSAAEPTE